jgi:predicted  nucleic acid-binding Zn-ribbon protein
LDQQLQEAHKQLQAQKQNFLAEQSKLEARTRDLQDNLAAVEQKAASLTNTSAAESRGDLEAELAENKQIQARLRQQLAVVQRQLEELKENYNAERSRLEARTKELQANQSEVEQKVKSLTNALASETKRRELVERLAVDAFKRRRELETELAKKQETEKALQLQMGISRAREGTGALGS